MSRKNYDTYKHRIDFYLEENGILDNSQYRLGMPAVISDPTIVARVIEKKINIEYWNYDTVDEPSYDTLKELSTKSNFKEHRNKNMLLHKLDFILKISFPIGVYKENMVIY